MAAEPYILPFGDILNGRIDPEQAERIMKQLSLFSCQRSQHITDFSREKMTAYEQASESRSYLFLKAKDDELLGFFTLGLTSMEWGNIENSDGWRKGFTKKQRRALSHGLFKRSGFVGMFTIGELARKDGIGKEELPGALILSAALHYIEEARKFSGGRFVLVDSRRKLFEALYQQAGFVEVDTRPSPNEGEIEEFVISILPLDDPR